MTMYYSDIFFSQRKRVDPSKKYRKKVLAQAHYKFAETERGETQGMINNFSRLFVFGEE